MHSYFILSCLALISSASAAAVCQPQTPGTDTENGVVNGNCCTDITVIFARGTFETGNVGTATGPPYFKALRSLLPGRVTIQGVDYPASLASLLSGGGSGPATMASLIQQAKSQCPNTKIIASGYSQGAEVVHGALSSSAVASMVSGAVLFGDPYNHQPVGALPQSMVKEYCFPGDVICETGVLLVTPSHYGYPQYANQAASVSQAFAGI